MTRALQRLLYKGRPYLGNNIQADKVDPVCFCKFVAVGEPLINTGCEIHTHPTYSCDHVGCHCVDYHPRREKMAPGDWPLCICGHLSQDHNPRE